MKSFEYSHSHEKNEEARDTAITRRGEAELSALAGNAKESITLAKKAREVANELYQAYRKLELCPLDAPGHTTREDHLDYYRTLDRKDALKRRYEELLAKLEGA
jgi:hypothetical protein